MCLYVRELCVEHQFNLVALRTILLRQGLYYGEVSTVTLYFRHFGLAPVNASLISNVWFYLGVPNVSKAACRSVYIFNISRCPSVWLLKSQNC